MMSPALTPLLATMSDNGIEHWRGGVLRRIYRGVGPFYIFPYPPAPFSALTTLCHK